MTFNKFCSIIHKNDRGVFIHLGFLLPVNQAYLMMQDNPIIVWLGWHTPTVR
nr:MAG TPA: hypothetical protein [Caudoviricetes sp.]